MSIASAAAPGLTRGPSRSSTRRIIFQPRWRANAQFTKNVRALPRCRAPVGDGASRVRDMEFVTTRQALTISKHRHPITGIEQPAFSSLLTIQQIDDLIAVRNGIR